MNQKNSTRPPTAHIAPFGVRMQPELKQRLEEAAKEAGRSMNAEIVFRLASTFRDSEHYQISSLNHEAQEVKELEEAINEHYAQIGKVIYDQLRRNLSIEEMRRSLDNRSASKKQKKAP